MPHSTVTRAVRSIAVAVVAPLALTAATGVADAGASTARRHPLAVVRAECNRKIDQRVMVLADLKAKATGSRHLADTDKTEIVASIDETTTVLLTMYRPAVNAATSKATLAQACRAIFVDLRIFAVYVPQTRSSATLDALEDFDAQLASQVAAASASGTDTAAWDALLASASTKLDDAAARIPAVTPATFNADPAGTRATWDAVHADLSGAFGDLLQVHRGLHPAGS